MAETQAPPRGLLDDLRDLLAEAGVVGGVSGWPLYLGSTPPSPDQVVALFERPGRGPDARTSLERPFLQVLVRGRPHDYTGPRAKLAEVERCLHRFTGAIEGRHYAQILAFNSGAPLGQDKSERWEMSQSYEITRSRT